MVNTSQHTSTPVCSCSTLPLAVLMEDGIKELCHRSMMAIIVKEKIAKRYEEYSEGAGIIAMKKRESTLKNLCNKYDSRIKSAVAPTCRMGV